MTFDKTQPTDTTKIRNLGTVIRPNWVAIEEAASSFKPRALNLDNRTVLGVPVNPTAIANSMILFSKSDASGKTQLYTIDPDSHVTQISVAVAPLSSGNGYTWLPGGMLLQWGTVIAPPGDSGNFYFPVAFSGTPYSIPLTFIRAAGTTGENFVYVTSGQVTSTRFRTTTVGTTGSHHVYYMAIGPKV